MVEQVRENVRIVEEITASLGTEDVVAAMTDEHKAQRVVETFDRLAERDFECVMMGPEYSPAEFRGRGLEGFMRAWQAWVEPFESFRIDLGESLSAGDCVVTFVRMTGRTKLGGVEVDQDGAAVWHLRDGKLHKVEFHLDRERALKSAGLEPEAE